MSGGSDTSTKVKYKQYFSDFLASIDYDRKDNFFYVILLSAPVLLTIYRYFTEAQDFLVYFPALAQMDQGEIWAYGLEYLSFFVLFLIVPLAILKYYNKNDILKEIIGIPKMDKTMKWVGLFLALYFIYSAFVGSSMGPILEEYPLPRTLLLDQSMLWFYLLIYLVLYYLPWEFFFRGVMLFGLKDKYGLIAAILIQTTSSCLVHIDKPAVEILGSIPFGILFGIIAFRTRSIWLVVLLHAILGIMTDIFIIF
ncbi:MAG: type II CAAX endopeptidase family protein [Saprospiraceae bacterium]|nr:type II CAAX endopeptidase family protein [Saprospiraceae bacterium]